MMIDVRSFAGWWVSWGLMTEGTTAHICGRANGVGVGRGGDVQVGPETNKQSPREHVNVALLSPKMM